MMAEENVLRLYDFSGGLNEKQSPFLLEKNESPSLQNVVFTKTGSLRKRDGYVKVLDDAEEHSEPIQGVYLFREEDGSEHLVGVTDTEIIEIDESSGTYSTLETGLSSVSRVDFTNAFDNLYIATGSNGLREYTGSTVNTISSAPEGTMVTSHHNRLFMAGDSAEPNYLYYSDLADPNTWGNFINITTDDGDRIRQIQKQRNNLIIFKTNSLHGLFGTSSLDFQVKEINNDIGTVAPESVVNARGRLIFLYNNGVYSFDGSSVNMLSVKIEPTIFDITHLSKCAALYHNNKYYLGYSDDSTAYNFRMIVYDLIHQAWSKFEGISARYFSNIDAGDEITTEDRDYRYFALADSNNVGKYGEVNFDAGDEINMRYHTKKFNLGQSEIVKTFRKFMFEGYLEQKMECTLSVESGKATERFDLLPAGVSDLNLWGENDWGELEWGSHRASSQGYNITDNFFGRDVQVQLYDSTGQNLEINGLLVGFRPRRKRFVGGNA